MSRKLADDAWYEAEPSLRRELIHEVRRLFRRSRFRWPLVLVLTVILTVGAGYKLAKRQPLKIASVTMSVTEGSLAHTGTLLTDLHNYVVNVLLPDMALVEIIERHDLTPLRSSRGIQYAINELRDQIEVEVVRNYFLYESRYNANSSARVEISVTDPDGVLAFELAHEVATAIIAIADAKRKEAGQMLRRLTEDRLDSARANIATLEFASAEAEFALANPPVDASSSKQSMLREDAEVLAVQVRKARAELDLMAASVGADAIAIADSDAGLGLTFAVVSETRPEVGDPGRRLRLAAIIAILAIMITVALVLVLGSFDDTVRDAEDVDRLGLVTIGHLPGFPGDTVGSLRDRDVRVQGRRRGTS